MRFFAIVFAAIVIAAHSLALPNVKNGACLDVHRSTRVHRDAGQDSPSRTRIESSVSVNSINSTDKNAPSNIPQKLKDVIALYEKNVTRLVEHVRGMCKNKNNNYRETYFQNQMKSLVEKVVREQSRLRNAYAKFGNVTDPTLQASSKKLSTEDINNLRNLLDTMKELDIVYQNGEITDEHIRIKRANEGYNGTASGREEQVIQVLFDLQRRLTQIRKYLDTLCKKYYSTWTTTTEINPVDKSNEVEIVQNQN